MKNAKANKKGQPYKEITQVKLSTVFYGNSAKDQCARFLQTLSRSKFNTDEAYGLLGVYHQPVHYIELTKHCLLINSVLENVEAENGVLRRVGSYVLRGDHND